jgi:hypothetical protein
MAWQLGTVVEVTTDGGELTAGPANKFAVASLEYENLCMSTRANVRGPSQT